MYDQFIWFTGVVEDRMDPLRLGRCKVRAFGYHSHDISEQPTETLPWALPLAPVTSASQTGVGESPTGPVEGTWVMGFFRDGKDMQEPIFMGTIPGIPETPGSKRRGAFADNRWAKREAVYELTGDPENPVQKDSVGGDPNTGYPQKPMSVDYIAEGTKLDPKGLMVTQQAQLVVTPLQPTPYPSLHFFGRPTIPLTSLGMDHPLGGHKWIQDQSSSTAKDISPAPSPARLRMETATHAKGWRIAKSSFDSGGAGVPHVWNEPSDPFNAKYPFNHAKESESGHLFELDDTLDAERVLIQHRSTSHIHFHPDGGRVDRTMQSYYHSVLGNRYEGTKGLHSISADGGFRVNVLSGSLVMRAAGDTVIQSDTGQIVLKAPGGVATEPGQDLEMSAGKGGKAGNMYVNSAERYDTSSKYEHKVKGDHIVNAATLQFSAMTSFKAESTGNMVMAPKGQFNVNAACSKEFYTNEFLGNYKVPGTDWAGKEIEVMQGNIELKVNTGNPKLGNISLMVKAAPIPSPPFLPSDPSGVVHIQLNPLTAPLGIDMQAAGLINMKSGLVTNITSGLAMNLNAGLIMKIQGGLMTSIQAGLPYGIAIGGLIGTEPAVLGAQFAAEYAAHVHLSAVGPTTPPTTAAKVMTLLSKKAMFAG